MEESAQKNFLENEIEIVEQAKNDEAAFEILYNHYFPKIYGYLFKRVGNHETVEDLVSVTFLKVFSNLQDYKHQGFTFGAWVYRIATNNLTDYYRKQGKKKEVDIEEVAELKDHSLSPEEIANGLYNRKIIAKVLVNMPDKYQKIINLKFFGEKTNVEIAEILGVKENNCRVLTHRALKNFHKLYQKYV